MDGNKSRDEYYIINIDEGMTTDTKPLPDKKKKNNVPATIFCL